MLGVQLLVQVRYARGDQGTSPAFRSDEMRACCNICTPNISSPIIQLRCEPAIDEYALRPPYRSACHNDVQPRAV
jgi:hypothetical protein